MQKLTTGVMRRAKMAGADDRRLCGVLLHAADRCAAPLRSARDSSRKQLAPLHGGCLWKILVTLHYITFFNVA